jgi:hypothetical protein
MCNEQPRVRLEGYTLLPIEATQRKSESLTLDIASSEGEST